MTLRFTCPSAASSASASTSSLISVSCFSALSSSLSSLLSSQTFSSLRKSHSTASSSDPFSILGLRRGTATVSQCKEKYLFLAKLHHPDRQGGDEEKMKQLTQAFREATDQVKFATYYEHLNKKKKNPYSQQTAATTKNEGDQEQQQEEDDGRNYSYSKTYRPSSSNNNNNKSKERYPFSTSDSRNTEEQQQEQQTRQKFYPDDFGLHHSPSAFARSQQRKQAREQMKEKEQQEQRVRDEFGFSEEEYVTFMRFSRSWNSVADAAETALPNNFKIPSNFYRSRGYKPESEEDREKASRSSAETAAALVVFHLFILFYFYSISRERGMLQGSSKITKVGFAKSYGDIEEEIWYKKEAERLQQIDETLPPLEEMENWIDLDGFGREEEKTVLKKNDDDEKKKVLRDEGKEVEENELAIAIEALLKEIVVEQEDEKEEVKES